MLTNHYRCIKIIYFNLCSDFKTGSWHSNSKHVDNMKNNVILVKAGVALLRQAPLEKERERERGREVDNSYHK